ncbi:VOC family protein [Leifsonia sp. 1010]|uniref:VOC family protein n=1 Tax=Leifsonia sp. 1010 TaxID=2817769 RepID=UPI00285A9212|nr:VOC family protein [Leifsonia sp. 1010]MDR6612169.1 PhnB protein [Leifsonia sp. 1010]
MSIITTTHLNFRGGEARAALEFYAGGFGGEVTAATYADFGMPADVPGAQHIVFGPVASPEGFRVMAYDVPGSGVEVGTGAEASTRRENGMTITGQPFFVSVRAGSLDELTGYWDRLAEGASVVEPLAASAWSAGFGMLTDRFGVTWVLDVA